jgi:phospholipase C
MQTSPTRLLCLAALCFCGPADGACAAAPALTLALARDSAGAAAARDPARMVMLSPAAKLDLLRKDIRYVFVLFQENRSFDHYFGTYPGANGLFATFPGADPADPMQRAAKDDGSFHQVIRNPDGSFGTLTPFLSPRQVRSKDGGLVQLYPEDMASVDHSHSGMEHSMHFDTATRRHSKNDAYVLTMQGLAFSGDGSSPETVVDAVGSRVTAAPSVANHQAGELMLAHVDCDTVPFLWQLADRFTLFDNFHQTTIGPSTPNAIAMIAGQTGETQWALHPDRTGRHSPGGRHGIPIINDNGPFAGSPDDTSPGQKPPYGPDMQAFGAAATAPPALAPIAGATLTNVHLKGTPGPYNNSPRYRAQPPLTFASLPLSFMGQQIGAIVKHDENPATDLADVQDDIARIAAGKAGVAWEWYQQGYGAEPFDGKATINLEPAGTPHPSYIVHHNGPQYFGYLGDNPDELAHLHNLESFRQDVAAGRLPRDGGVFYVRGGYYNNDGLQTLDPNPDVRATFAGNDDHPGYSDSQISEALVADSVNAIAASPYWPHSVIIVTYDETDGLYDHVPERIRAWGPDGLPLTGGPRIPAIVISPYGAAHAISHVYSEHSSVIKFIDALFGLTPLADLPDERRGRDLGAANPTHDPDLRAPDGSAQHDLGPADDLVDMGDLSEAFDNDRLAGRAPLLPPSLATIDDPKSLPHLHGAGCAGLKIVPTDYPNGLKPGSELDPPPADFNPRPTVSPGIPTSGTWVP